MYIAKFGGSILKDFKDLSLIKDIILKDFNDGKSSIYVFSAFWGITNKLIDIFSFLDKDINKSLEILNEVKSFHFTICDGLAIKNKDFLEKLFHEFNIKLLFFHTRQLSLKIKDYIISFGEILSSLIVFNYLKDYLKIEYINSSDLIKTDNNFGNANIDFKLTEFLIQQTIQKDRFYICAGFIGSTKDGFISTLGRNGSDYSAAIFGAAIDAIKVDIWKDVEGVFTADPKIVKNALKIKHISYKEMSELCFFGAKVIYLDALYPLLKKNIPIEVKNLYSKNKGTIISYEHSSFSVVGITQMKATIISISGFKAYQEKFDISSNIISILLKEKIDIIGAFQFSSILSFTIIIQYTDSERIMNILKDIPFEFLNLNMNLEQNSSIIAVIGENMLKIPGVLGEIFNALSIKKISVDSCVTGFNDINICFSISDSNKNDALNVIHDSIFKINH